MTKPEDEYDDSCFEHEDDDDDDDKWDDDDPDYICPACNGSGEGMADGSSCRLCGGSGGLPAESSGGDADREEDKRDV